MHNLGLMAPNANLPNGKKTQMLKSCQDFSVSKQYRSTAPQHAPDSISPRPWSNLGSDPHPSRHWISWSHIFKKQFSTSHGQVIIASRPHLWSRYSNREPPWHRFPNSRQHFSRAAVPRKKKHVLVERGKGRTFHYPFGTASKKKHNVFILTDQLIV